LELAFTERFTLYVLNLVKCTWDNVTLIPSFGEVTYVLVRTQIVEFK